MSMSPQAMILNFKESPYSPWGSEVAARSRAGFRPLATGREQRYSATVGRISAVNALIGEQGLLERVHLPPLVVDRQGSAAGVSRGREDTSSDSAGGSGSETEMDRRPRRGRGGRRRRSKPNQRSRQTTFNKVQHTKTTRKEEEVKPEPRPPTGGEDSSSEEEEEEEEERYPADTALVELASYPGYDPDHLTPLPHKLLPLEQMKRVTRAQTKLASKREGFRETWIKLFYSSASLAIYQDYFWWYFLHCYQAGQHPLVQDLLFARISNNYVKLLCEPIEERWRGAFFKMYPDVIAQCVYSTFIHAYPTSWNSFDDNFKTELCRFISLWQVGTKPLPNSWEKWELSLLEPNNLLKHVAKDDQKSPVKDAKSPRRGTFDLDGLIKEAEERKNERTHQSSKPTTPCSVTKGETEKKITLSDIEKRLVSPSSSGHQLSPRSSTSSYKAARLAQSTGRAEREKAREQLTDLKKMLTEKRSSHNTPPTISSGDVKLVQTQSKQVKPGKQVQPSTQGKQVQPGKQIQPGKQVQQGKQVQPGPSIKVTTAQAKHGASTRHSKVSIPSPKQPKPSPKQSTASTPKPPASGSNKGDSLSPAKNKVPAAEREKTKQIATPEKKEENEKTWKEKALALCAKRKEEQRVPLEGPQFEHSVFDVCGHSPLVKYFLKNKDLKHKKQHSTLVKRTEIIEQPPHEAVCYKDVLDQSKEFEKKSQLMFRRHYHRQKQSMAQCQQARKNASDKHELAVQKVLSNKKETQELSNELTVHVLTSKSPNRVAVSKAVNETLDRVVHQRKTG